MIKVKIKGSARCLDENGDILELKPVVFYSTSTFDKAKRDSMALLQDEVEELIEDAKAGGEIITLISLQLVSVVDHENNQHHYGQLPY